MRYLTLPFKVKMEHFETYSTHPAVNSIDSISICMKNFGVENLCLYEMAFHIFIFSCLLSDIKGNVCAIIVHSWIEATSATVLIKLHESWPLQ